MFAMVVVPMKLRVRGRADECSRNGAAEAASYPEASAGSVAALGSMRYARRDDVRMKRNGS
jgi:hypothetical protein